MNGLSKSLRKDVVKVSALLFVCVSLSISLGLYISLERVDIPGNQHLGLGWTDGSSLPLSTHEEDRTDSNHARYPSPILWADDHSKQVEKKDKNGKILHHSITTLKATDLQGLQGSNSSVDISATEARKGREYTLKLLADAGIHEIEPAVMTQLPKWSNVAALYYYNRHGLDVTEKGPVIIGLDTCERFRTMAPADDASVGVAGLFNTGTNPAAMYLSANCQMPHNTKDKSGHGMRWQVPWGKHMLASRKLNNTAGHDAKVNKTNVLPVVLVRDPFTWMASMCKHPYAAKWKFNATNCPNLLSEGHSNRVSIKYPKETIQWESLIDLWTDWYTQYLDLKTPRLIVRFEDLIFRPKELVNEVCTCAGAVAKTDQFSYVVDAGKWGSSVHKGSSNRITAMIKYGKTRPPMSDADNQYAHQRLSLEDSYLMNLFQYQL